jgi:hypothetical protein
MGARPEHVRTPDNRNNAKSDGGAGFKPAPT